MSPMFLPVLRTGVGTNAYDAAADCTVGTPAGPGFTFLKSLLLPGSPGPVASIPALVDPIRYQEARRRPGHLHLRRPR